MVAHFKFLRPRVPYTEAEDKYFVKYLARYNPDKKGRMGNAIYKTLEENVRDNK